MLLDCRMGWAMCSFSVALCFCAFAFIIITSLIQFTSQKIKNYKAPFPLDAEKETIDGNGFPKVKEANLCNRRRFLLNKQMGDIDDDKVKPKRIVFVTVGTTCFDALVKAVDTEKVKETLSSKGYTHLLIQMGRGSYLPTKSDGEDGSLVTDYFSFSSSIADHLRSASLVISHAGSGSIFETLRLGKPLIVVVNEDLMDNHQSELAEELAERKHLFCAHPQTLFQTIAGMDLESLIPYPPGDATPVAKLINKFLGFPDE
ncbi:uncharacterized protein LOC132299736 isoform X2 [Cornus florida]|uniref:uncharacterized protein LOC132299736 isoform X2 n=1 Tax=Cornus florida TaxID=4283 RepID=UPI00289E8ADF|nr:uncharacterized protein LOC132299736 isoform X2 [Cornus florida]